MTRTHLPPEKYITALLTQVQPALASSNPAHQKAGYQALAVSAEGCMESIRTKYLNNFLQILGTGIKHDHPAVRNAALYMLVQFSEFYNMYLDKSLSSLPTCTVKPSTTVSIIFYALETFCENFEMKLVPHLDLIMSRVVSGMGVRIQELAVSLVGAARSC